MFSQGCIASLKVSFKYLEMMLYQEELKFLFK